MIMMTNDIRGWRDPSFPDICLTVEVKSQRKGSARKTDATGVQTGTRNDVTSRTQQWSVEVSDVFKIFKLSGEINYFGQNKFFLPLNRFFSSEKSVYFPWKSKC